MTEHADRLRALSDALMRRMDDAAGGEPDAHGAAAVSLWPDTWFHRAPAVAATASSHALAGPSAKRARRESAAELRRLMDALPPAQHADVPLASEADILVYANAGALAAAEIDAREAAAAAVTVPPRSANGSENVVAAVEVTSASGSLVAAAPATDWDRVAPATDWDRVAPAAAAVENTTPLRKADPLPRPARFPFAEAPAAAFERYTVFDVATSTGPAGHRRKVRCRRGRTAIPCD